MSTYAAIRAIDYYLPEKELTNDELARLYPEWTAEKILDKTGIGRRHIAAADETSADLAYQAGEQLLTRTQTARDSVDFVLFCTQSPDYFLPTSACLLQDRLGLPTTAGALDFNLGCSGFVYGLSMAKALVETGQAQRVLLLTGETYSKFIHPGDKSVRTLFGDAGSATLVDAAEAPAPPIGPFVYGTDGRGGTNLMVPTGGMRSPSSAESAVEATDAMGSVRSGDSLFMNGPEIFAFTLKSVPAAVRALLEKAGQAMDDIDWFVFHQANNYMLEHLRKKIGIPAERFPVELADVGNTVSATIPIVLRRMESDGRLRDGQQIMLVGFGVGYSWAAAGLTWQIA